MIPLRLTLTNFLSYREPANLDLRGVHLACIAGLNGAGKSSILDAVTWVIFGKSRAGSDDLIVNRVAARNNEAAEVQFDFELEGVVYRIRRRKQIGRATELEFQLLAESDTGAERWSALTEARKGDTQAAVGRLLRMDYDIFTNASFLLQGQADEFTTKTPNKRKEILADILGVSEWDDYRDAVTERRKAAENDLALQQRQLEDVQAELAEEEVRRRELESAREREADLTASRDRQEALVAQYRQTRALADQQRSHIATLTADRDRLVQELTDVTTRTEQRSADLEAYSALISRQADIESRFASWQSADMEFARQQELADEHNRLSLAMQPYVIAVAEARTRLEQQVKQLEAQGERVAAAEAEEGALRSALEKDRAEMAVLQHDLKTARELEEQWQQLNERRRQLLSDRQLWEQERDQLRQLEGHVATARQQRDIALQDLKAGEAEVIRLGTEIVTLLSAQQRLTDVRSELERLSAEQTRLRPEMQEKRARIDKLAETTEQDCPLCGQPLTEEHRSNVLAQLQAEGDQMGARYRANKARIEELEAELPTLSTTLKRLPALEQQRDAQQQRVGHAEARLQELERQVDQWEASEHATRLQTLDRLLADNEPLNLVNEQLAELDRRRQARQRLEQTAQALSERIARSEARLAQLSEMVSDWEQQGKPALEDTRRRLSADDFAVTERAELSELEAKQRALNFEPLQLEGARGRRTALAEAPIQHQQLQQAKVAIKPVQEALDDLSRRRAEIVRRQAEVEAQIAAAETSLAELEASSSDLRSAQVELDRLREDVIAANRAVGAAQQRLAVLDDQRRRADVLNDSMAQWRLLVRRLKQLEEACGRNGVQALLIESALPELEEQANELLDRLTDGEMRIMFETQRQLKTLDKQTETLEIKISDSYGERPYENYSGGEKFRINFAVRLALSQVLARRSGARLQMLVIDEGFGSQDPEGRQRLVEAINAVQSQFATILIITHIDELRDKFPARIDVEKSAGGSRLSLTIL